MCNAHHAYRRCDVVRVSATQIISSQAERNTKSGRFATAKLSILYMRSTDGF